MSYITLYFANSLFQFQVAGTKFRRVQRPLGTRFMNPGERFNTTFHDAAWTRFYDVRTMYHENVNILTSHFMVLGPRFNTTFHDAARTTFHGPL